MARKGEAEVAIRQTDVRNMMLQGKSTSHIIAYMGETYKIARSTTERDITIVYRHLRTYLEKAKDDIIAEHIGKYDKIFEDCCELANYRDALKALRQKEELLKYHRNEPLISFQNNTINMDNVTDDVLIKSIENIKRLKDESGT